MGLLQFQFISEQHVMKTVESQTREGKITLYAAQRNTTLDRAIGG